jgi:AsmA protein
MQHTIKTPVRIDKKMILFLRWMVGILFILAVSLFLLILSLPVLFNPNDYKTQLADLVREKTGRELLVTGNIQAKISPWLNVTCSLGKVRLANHSPFPNSSLLAVEQANIELSLWPLLLQRRLHMANIILDGVTLNLLHNKEGLNNWETLPPLPDPVTKPEESAISTEIITEPQPAAVSLQKQPLFTNLLTKLLAKLIPPAINLLPGHVSGIDFGNVQLTAVNARYEDQQTDTIITYQDLRLKTGQLREKIPFPFETDFTLSLDHRTAKTDPIHSGEITMQGNATLFLQEPHLLLEDVRLDGVVKGKVLPKRGLKFSAATNSDIHLQQQKISIKDFTLNHEDTRLQGSGTVEDVSSPRFKLALKIPECAPQTLLKQLKASHPNLQTFLQHTDHITRLRGELLLAGNAERLDINDITLTIDDTTFTGAVAFIAAPEGEDIPSGPAYEAAIHIDHLDLDRYVPKQSGEVNGKETGASPLLIPVNFLKNLDLQLDLQLASLQIQGTQLSQVQMKIASKDGIAQLAPLTANLDDGSWKLEGQIDVTGNIPQVQAKQQLKRIKLEPLLQAITGKALITGTASIETDIKASGQSGDELLRHLNGTMQFDLSNGDIKSITILQKIRTARTLYQEETILPMATMTEEAAKDATEFSRLTGTARIEEGILRNDDLQGESALMQITGGGEIDLVRQHVDYTLQVVLAPDLGQDEGLELMGLGDTSIPYTITGPLTALSQVAKVEQLPKKATEQQPLQTLPQATTDNEPNEPKPEEIGTDIPPEPKEPETLGD